MADISQINVNGTTYNIKDTVARVSGVPSGGNTNQVLAKNSNSDYDLKWVNQSGGGGVSQLVIVTAEDFAEETITLTNADDGTTLTKTADADGVAKFNVSSAGTWTATADDSGTTVTLGSVTLNVSEINYSSEVPDVCFAFHIDQTESDPDSMITYPVGYDNSDWASDTAYMDFQNNTFHWGAFDPNGVNASKVLWLIPRSCMLKYDKTVDYYLDENNNAKKVDGTVSDIANTSYGGNAMMEWGQEGRKIWKKIVPDATGATICIANYQRDSDFHCWNFYDSNNNVVDHFYTPKYRGSLVNNVMRSLSGQSLTVSLTRQQEIDYAKANNTTSNVEWFTETFSDWSLIRDILTLMCKSTDLSSKFGYGNSSGSSLLTNGGADNKGMFWGSNDGKSTIKVLGMENLWSNAAIPIAGYTIQSGDAKIKLTYGTADGTSVSAYNLDGTGYLTNGTTPSASQPNGRVGYIKTMYISANGMTPNDDSASSNTYYAARMFSGASNCYALMGDGKGTRGSMYSIYIIYSSSTTDGGWNASISCR